MKLTLFSSPPNFIPTTHNHHHHHHHHHNHHYNHHHHHHHHHHNLNNVTHLKSQPKNQSLLLCSSNHTLKLPNSLTHFSTSTLFLFALGIFSFSKPPSLALALHIHPPLLHQTIQLGSIAEQGNVESSEDKDLQEAFESWKSKTYALTVPLRVVALQGSVPPAWIKEFIQCQGRRLKLGVQFYGTLDVIFSKLLKNLSKAEASSKSTHAADLVTVGDSWLDLAIRNSIIEPIHCAEGQDWFRLLTEKWKVYLRRNSKGEIDPDGRIWAVPYRWGSMVIAYKKSKFDKLGLAPIEDWADLWRPELAGRISMIDDPREVVGMVLKYMGTSYNTDDINKDVPGGIDAVRLNLSHLAKQVLVFDSSSYLKAFSVGDAWVAVGWSSDILPAAKRLSNVAVVVPKSGSSLWADLWAVPSTARCPPTEKLGGRIRGPSPLIHQWFEFCLQPTRALPFKQGVLPGAPPSTLEDPPIEPSKDLLKGAPKLVTNLIDGVPPREVLSKCEFLEPLSEAAFSDYTLLIASLQKPDRRLFEQFFARLRSLWFKGGS